MMLHWSMLPLYMLLRLMLSRKTRHLWKSKASCVWPVLLLQSLIWKLKGHSSHRSLKKKRTRYSLICLEIRFFLSLSLSHMTPHSNTNCLGVPADLQKRHNSKWSWARVCVLWFILLQKNPIAQKEEASDLRTGVLIVMWVVPVIFQHLLC